MSDHLLQILSDSTAVDRCLHVLRLLSLGTRGLRQSLGRLLDPCDLSESQFMLLATCAAGPREGSAQRELAESLALSPAQVSGLVEQLRRRGLIEAAPSDDDRRRQPWRITPTGSELLQTAKCRLADWAKCLDAALSDEDQRRLTELLAQLSASLAAPSTQRRAA